MLTPTSPSAIAAHKLRRMVAASPTWLQAIEGVIYPDDENLAGIYLRDLDGDTPRPHGNVSLVEGSTWGLKSGGFSNGMLPGGSLALWLALDVPPELAATEVDAEFFAANLFDGTLHDVAGLSNADDPTAGDGLSYLNVTQIQQIGFTRTDPAKRDTLGDFFQTLYLIRWGDAQA